MKIEGNFLKSLDENPIGLKIARFMSRRRLGYPSDSVLTGLIVNEAMTRDTRSITVEEQATYFRRAAERRIVRENAVASSAVGQNLDNLGHYTEAYNLYKHALLLYTADTLPDIANLDNTAQKFTRMAEQMRNQVAVRGRRRDLTEGLVTEESLLSDVEELMRTSIKDKRKQEKLTVLVMTPVLKGAKNNNNLITTLDTLETYFDDNSLGYNELGVIAYHHGFYTPLPPVCNSNDLTFS